MTSYGYISYRIKYYEFFAFPTYYICWYTVRGSGRYAVRVELVVGDGGAQRGGQRARGESGAGAVFNPIRKWALRQRRPPHQPPYLDVILPNAEP